MIRSFLLPLLLAAIVAGCATPVPAASGSSAVGSIRISVARAAGATEFHRSERHARILSGGAVAFDGGLDADGVTTAEVPVGRSNVSAFTVFFGDFLVCPGGETASTPACIQPTLQPARTCDLEVDVTEAQPVELTFTVLADGGCRLEVGAAAPDPVPGGPASPSPT